jgi:selenocysteine lyase/cysteine desulfurase
VLGAQRDLFSMPPEVAYFNTATLAPQLRSVRAAGEAALERRSQPWTITNDQWFGDVERLRGLIGGLVGADAEGIALVPATSYGFAVAARNLGLGAGDRVLVLAEDYPSGVYTWRTATRAVGGQIVTVARTEGQSWTEAVLAALDERIRVVSVPNVHWTDGALIDLPVVAARCREVGARLVIDASQSVGAMPLDVVALHADFAVTVGYKWLLGPMSLGYLYVAEEHRDGQPLEENWISREGSEVFGRLVDYRDEYQPGARRYDVGQRSKFELVQMAIAALEQLTAWEVPRIAEALARITGSVADRAAELGLHPVRADERGPHMLGLRFEESLREAIVPALAAAGCYAAVRGDSLRIAPHLHVTDADVDCLVDALAAATRVG